MTEPERWVVTASLGRATAEAVEVVAAADFDRLRDERDRAVTALREIAAAGWSFDLDEQYPHHDPPLDNDRDFAEFGHRVARSALAVFDTLTEGEDR